MKISILERLLQADRFRPKVSTKTGNILPPVVTKRVALAGEAPFVVSRAKGGFTLTRPNVEDEVSQAFSYCPVGEEDLVFRNLYDTLWQLGKAQGWDNRYASLEAAIAGASFPPKSLVVPFSTLREIVEGALTEEEAERITLAKGFVTEVSGLRVLSARGALPPGTAVLASAPEVVGSYMRSADHLSVMILRADRSLVLVGDAVD
jgi:hypothetical protein